MKNDYLWDRTGEPDPEIQQLEELLGTLRYQPQPLELPADVKPDRRQRRFLPSLAIAATIALLVLATGLWVRLHRRQVPTNEIAGQSSSGSEKQNSMPPTTTASSDTGNRKFANDRDQGADKRVAKNTLHRAARHSLAGNVARHRNPAPPTAGLTAEERSQALAAKEQLLLALRVASAKLNFAQRKTQGPPAPNTIRNQHKNG